MLHEPEGIESKDHVVNFGAMKLCYDTGIAWCRSLQSGHISMHGDAAFQAAYRSEVTWCK